MQRSLVLAVVAAALVTSAPLGRAQMPMKGMEMKGAARPYAGQQSREIKALSPEEIGQYLSGAGMGYAKPAELNGYPGPMHVLENADGLALTPEQRKQTTALMKALLDLGAASRLLFGREAGEATAGQPAAHLHC